MVETMTPWVSAKEWNSDSSSTAVAEALRGEESLDLRACSLEPDIFLDVEVAAIGG